MIHYIIPQFLAILRTERGIGKLEGLELVAYRNRVLKVLTDLGLITSRKEGLNVFYRSVPKKLTAYLQYLNGIGTRSHH